MGVSEGIFWVSGGGWTFFMDGLGRVGVDGGILCVGRCG